MITQGVKDEFNEVKQWKHKLAAHKEACTADVVLKEVGTAVKEVLNTGKQNLRRTHDLLQMIIQDIGIRFRLNVIRTSRLAPKPRHLSFPCCHSQPSLEP